MEKETEETYSNSGIGPGKKESTVYVDFRLYFQWDGRGFGTVDSKSRLWNC